MHPRVSYVEWELTIAVLDKLALSKSFGRDPFEQPAILNHRNVYCLKNHYSKYRVIRNDCRGSKNLPPCSPDATPCDFFLWGYIKDQVYVPPLPASIPELKVQIKTATETITADMLQTVWNELDNRVDVCRITKGAHIEHLYGM